MGQHSNGNYSNSYCQYGYVRRRKTRGAAKSRAGRASAEMLESTRGAAREDPEMTESQKGVGGRVNCT